LNPVLRHLQSVLFPNVRRQVSHPYKATGRIMVLREGGRGKSII
jgi:hypothetical protein